MENKKICPECGTSYPPSRSDQVYCDTTCRWNSWRKKKAKQKGASLLIPADTTPETRVKLLEGIEQTGIEDAKTSIANNLRGVIVKGQSGQQIKEDPIFKKPEGSVAPVIPKPLPEPTQVETQAYKDALAKNGVADAFVTRVLGNIALCERTIGKCEEELTKAQKAPKRNRVLNTDILDLDESLLWDELTQPLVQTERQKHLLEEIANLKHIKIELNTWLKRALEEAKKAAHHLAFVPRHEKIAKASPLQLLSIINGLKKAQGPKNEPEPQVKQDELLSGAVAVEHIEKEEPGIKSPKNRIEVETDDDLISNEQLSEMEFHCLDFQKKWLEFFGQPAVVFHLAVHGRSGHGKSNFCFQLADYLANNFGNTVYISGEEGFSKTLKDKKMFNKVESKHIYWCRHKNFEAIKSNLKNQFNFIFLDSLDTLGIDAVKLRELRALFPDSAFITISQSTKAGGMRGSNEILHDSDMAVQVHDGIATTTKNRFKKSGMEFRVFTSL